jgi:hypothetical protein
MNKEKGATASSQLINHRGETGATVGHKGEEPDSLDLQDMGEKYSKFISFL